MTTQLEKFLAPLTLEDFQGASTKKNIKTKADKFIGSDAYEYGESFTMGGEKYDIHNSLLCLVYDNI